MAVPALRDNSVIENTTNWHVFKAKPGGENQALQHLKRQGFEVFLPKVRTTLRRGSRLIDKDTWLFPGYGFVRFDCDPVHIRAINATRGVGYLISHGDKPANLPEGFVDTLRNLCADNVLSSLPESAQVGDNVEFLSGPFVNQIGKLVKMGSGGRVRVLMKLLSGAVHIETRVENLIPV